MVALRQLWSLTFREARVQTFADAFLVIAVSLAIATLLVPLLRKVVPAAAPSADAHWKQNTKNKQSTMKTNETNQSSGRITKIVMVVLAAWLALVIFLGERGVFLGAPGTPPLQLLLSVAIPIIAFLGSYGFSKAFRGFVLAFDPQLGAGIQAWRFAGLGFLALYAYNILPGQFALPAGIGDMLIGITAPLVLLKLIRQPSFARTRLFAVWNLLGILDLVVAVSSGGLNAFLAHGTPNEVTTRPMAQLPLVLIPAYFVPIFMMVHFSALFQLSKAHCPAREESPDVASTVVAGAH